MQLPPADMTLKGFDLQKPADAKAVRVRCSLSTSYLDAYYTSAETHYAFALTSDEGEFTIRMAYAPKNSDHGRRLFEMLKNGETSWLTVRLQRIGPTGQQLPANFYDGFAVVSIVESKIR